MFIKNAECIKSTVLMDAKVGKHLQSVGVPLLGILEGQYVFKDTELLRKEIKMLPISLKIRLIMKGGGQT